MAKAGIGLRQHGFEFRLRKAVAGKAADHLGRHIHIGLAGKIGNFCRCQSGIMLRKIKAAITRQTGQQGINEV